MMFKHLIRHIALEILSDGEKTRHMLRNMQTVINLLERENHHMALNTKDVLAKLQAQSTQIDGVLVLCDTLHQHLDTVIKKLNDGSVGNAEVQKDLQDMADLLDNQSAKIANAITTDADINDQPAPTNPPSETGDQTGSGNEGTQGQPQTGDSNPAPNPNEPGSPSAPVGSDQSGSNTAA